MQRLFSHFPSAPHSTGCSSSFQSHLYLSHLHIQLQSSIKRYFWKLEQDFPAGLFHTQSFYYVSNMLFGTLKTDVVYSSETPTTTYQTSESHTSEGHSINFTCMKTSNLWINSLPQTNINTPYNHIAYLPNSVWFWISLTITILARNQRASSSLLAQLIFSTPKMEAIRSSETSADTQPTTWRYIPEDGTLQRNSWLALHSLIVFMLSS
jgi:hypothetical protein